MNIFNLKSRAPSLLLFAAALLLLGGCSSSGGGGTNNTSTPNAPPPADPPPPAGIPSPLPSTTTAQPRSFPGTTPTVTLPVDDSNYAVTKRAFELSHEYALLYTQTSILTGVTTTYEFNHHLLINSAAAYARGATGAGETIMITDSGIDETHFEFAETGGGKVTKSTQDGYTPNAAAKTHGTSVAGIAAAKRQNTQNTLGMHGVAFDAKIAFHEIRLGASDGIYRPSDVAARTAAADQSLAEFFQEQILLARANDAAIINMSFGVAGIIDDYDAALVRNRYRYSGAAQAQLDVDPADRIIHVWAAGNAANQVLTDGTPVNPTSVDLWAGLGLYMPELQGHVVAVVAVDGNGDLASFSNPCGAAKAFCLAAPGLGLLSPFPRGASTCPVENIRCYNLNFSGTSAAAPVVSGGLAVLRQYFRRQLGNTELVSRMLATADRSGKYADSDKYGSGLLDLDAATAPVGTLMTGLPGDAASRVFHPGQITQNGGAFGQMAHALRGVEIAAFDELGAPFFFPMDAQVSAAARTHADIREYQAALGASANHATFALQTTDGALSTARFARDRWWFAYGHHAGREGGAYALQDFANFPARSVGIGVGGGVTGAGVTSGGGLRGGASALQFRSPLAFAPPYLSLVRDGPGFGWTQRARGGARLGFSLLHGAPQFDRYANPGGARGFGALFDFRPRGAAFSLQGGAVREEDGFLGTRPGGALGIARADTAFAGIGGDWAARNRWRLLASAYVGGTRAQLGGGMLREDGNIFSSAFSLGAARASRARRGDWFGLRLSQPLRAERGHARLRLVSGRSKYGEVVHTEHRLNLTPAGRNLQAEAVYRMPFFGGALSGELGVERHAQHDVTRGVEGFAKISFMRRF